MKIELVDLFFQGFILIDFLSVRASFGESSPPSGRLAEHDIAVSAQHDSLCMAENGGNLKASWALDIHEKGIWALHESLKLVSSEFKLSRRMQQISRHFDYFRLAFQAVAGGEKQVSDGP